MRGPTMSLELQYGVKQERLEGRRMAVLGFLACGSVLETGFKDVDSRQALAFEELQEGTTSGRNITNLVLNLEDVDRRNRVTTTGQCKGL